MEPLMVIRHQIQCCSHFICWIFHRKTVKNKKGKLFLVVSINDPKHKPLNTLLSKIVKWAGRMWNWLRETECKTSALKENGLSLKGLIFCQWVLRWWHNRGKYIHKCTSQSHFCKCIFSCSHVEEITLWQGKFQASSKSLNTFRVSKCENV